MPPETIVLSLNEVELLAMKAVRGAGLPWGAAEDAGRAAVWLARRTEHWAQSLLDVLRQTVEPGMSPLLVAGVLADAASTLSPCHFGKLIAPIWALPAVLTAASTTIVIDFGEACIGRAEGGTIRASATIDTVIALPGAPLSLTFPPTMPALLTLAWEPRRHRAQIARDVHHGLSDFVSHTYVKSNVRSRLTGAGAGLGDQD